MSVEISLSAVNKKSPYKMSQTGSGSFLFTTDLGTTYEIGVVDDYMLGTEDLYQFYIECKGKAPSYKDGKIRLAVIALLEEFFKTPEATLDYICMTEDGKQEMRDRLFKSWFSRYTKNAGFQFFSLSRTFDDITYYAAVIMRKDNPHFLENTKAISDFSKMMNEK